MHNAANTAADLAHHDEHDFNCQTILVTEAGFLWRRVLCRLECKIKEHVAQGWHLCSISPVHDDTFSFWPKLRIGYIAVMRKHVHK